mmetsp:Transcript_27470/g.42341  ORF Transcript_27470/g.42341 Transcript_27470/m.42341 type:complete len:242 (+) Transcript_27470:202-927(+)
MEIFSCLSGGNNKQLKKSLQASEDEVVSLKKELDERNKRLKSLEEKHVEEINVKAAEAKILEEKNSECTAKIEDLASRNRELEAANKVYIEEEQELTAQISQLNTLCSDYKEQVESNKEKQIQLESAQMSSCASAIMAATSDEEIQDVIKTLVRKNDELEIALACEKEKSQRRKQEASDRRAKFKERVQNLTRKLSDDESSGVSNDSSSDESNDSSSDGSNDSPIKGSLFGTPKAGNTPKR